MIKFTCEQCSKDWYIPEEHRKTLQACPYCLTLVPQEEEIVVNSFEKAILKTIRELGVVCLSERGKFIGYLMDSYPEYKKEVKILSNACDAEVLIAFYKTREMNPIAALQVFTQIQHRLVDEEGIAELWAKTICNCIYNAVHPQKTKAPQQPRVLSPQNPQTGTQFSSQTKSQSTQSTNNSHIGFSDGFAKPPASAEPELPWPLFDIKGSHLIKYFGSDEIVKIPPNVRSIGFRAFYFNPNLKEIQFSSSVQEVEMEAFAHCKKLETIVFNKEIRSIQAMAFFGCESLKKLYLPNSVCTLGSTAFSQCSSLSEVRLPSAMTSLNDDVFKGCKNIRNVQCSKGCLSDARNTFRSARVVAE